MKKLAILFMIAGLVLVAIGGYELIKTKAAERNTLNEAHQLLNVEKDEANTKTDPSEFFPDMGETVGILEMPSIDAELPIVEGTDADDLEKGVGHYKGTAYPRQQDQIVLSGHRDTVFRKLGDIEIGDIFILKLPYGEFTYEMVDSKIVDADDRTIIKSTAPEEELVITTCYPFSYVGNAPERYIIYAKPIEE
ncbi:class D sortase [Aquibacillus rhizosphaerae]|uniref:Class D sortase n=1 Tax=Aquibacillus rhizosphaerae TaxID=3051431 RepID=A0ABT7L0C2_9BACI|nr:class D sortase [Aquibacillus sp. LR5S19]MDL4839204.1 class D sortase [Aquibacillus sp. LR5S19]